MERSTRLTEMLQIYAHQNPHIGYRQGMHEIASYLLLVIEMDLFDQESQQREVSPLLDPNYIAHDAYYMLLAIMSQLGPAYDVKMNTGAESPMEQMAQSILTKIRDVANDKSLYQHLLSLNCPPELYCTRWVRLMFSREVAGWKNVLLLWDIFLDLTSKSPLTSMSRSRYTRPGVTPALELGDFSLMMVLEATSASMILLQRNALLSIHDGTDADSIHRLMNIPPLKNILPLTATLLSLMRRIQLQQRHSVKVPESKRRSFTLSEIAHNAISTGGQSILNILQGGNGQACAEDERPRLTAVTSSTSAVASFEIEKEDMAERLKQSVFIVKTYLQALEHPSAANLGSSTPQSVWDALEEIDVVQQELTKIILRE
jgi:Rab-GTPase-TBC domain